ncbi:hypothetical protein A9Q99_16960 [Gammaproteobacteria bacterium 45_16_T64]|mgnify:CR=1 FL=1|nr:hypothetical protein A9Q99_16960 [Gammaproteobacteria bacterium 45_16_T64]
MKHYILPEALHGYPGVKTILRHNDSCIMFKRLTDSILEQEKLSVSHCAVFVVRGRVEVKTPEGEHVVCHEQELLFMPRDRYLISDFITGDYSLEVFLLFFDHDVIVKFLNAKQSDIENLSNSRAKGLASICKLKATKKLACYFDALKDIYFDVENDQHILTLKLLEFLHLVNIENQQEIITALSISDKNKRKRNIESIMLDNFDQSLNVEDFANLSGRSVSTFTREFSRKHGKTPKQWLISKRMEKAQALLVDGANVTDCALSVGYSNVSHFIKAYKTVYGETPASTKRMIERK